MLWHPKTLQNLAMYHVFFIFGRFSIAGKLPKWLKIPFQYPRALRHPKILEKCRKHHRILVSVRNRFWAPPAKADIATAILTNVIEHLVLLFCPPISTPSPPKRCGRIKIYIWYCQKLDFEASPNIPLNTLIIIIKIKLVRWDTNKKISRWQSIFINRGLNPLFHHPVLLLIFNYHNSESNCAQPKRTEVPHQSYFF